MTDIKESADSKDRYSKLHNNATSAKNEALTNFARHTFGYCTRQDRKGFCILTLI
jgi:hypothetical protein